MKDFDIYLQKHLTQCDIIVYSIPYRDGLTAFNRLALKSCLDSYLLQKFVAVQTGSELVAHVDKMIKICCERLALGFDISATAELSTKLFLSDNICNLELNMDKIHMLERVFEKIETISRIDVEPLRVTIDKSAGLGNSDINISPSVDNILKTSSEHGSSEVLFSDNIIDTTKLGFDHYSNAVLPSAIVDNLCYQVLHAGETVLHIAAYIHEIELSYSLGGKELNVHVSASACDGDVAYKYEPLALAVSVISELVESIIQYACPQTATFDLFCQISTSLRRYRQLNELDHAPLSSMDDLTLKSLDYIIEDE